MSSSMSSKAFNNLLDDFLTLTSSNTDYIWVKFTKPCGYSFVFPFLKNCPSSSLYTHIDSYWSDTNNTIWNNNGDILHRSHNKTIRDWINETRMISETSVGQPLLYSINFDISSYDLNNIRNNHNHNHN